MRERKAVSVGDFEGDAADSEARPHVFLLCRQRFCRVRRADAATSTRKKAAVVRTMSGMAMSTAIEYISGGATDETMGEGVAYLDNAATTPIRPEALQAYVRACAEAFGNPSSLHQAGRAGHQALEWARGIHARLLGVAPECVFFTSGGTESNNIAIRGVLAEARPARTVILTTTVEHSSVRRTAELAAGAANVVRVPVDRRGYVDEDAFRAALRAHSSRLALITIILAQNEVGTIQHVAELVRTARELAPGVPFHTDATQAFGKYLIRPSDLGVDMLTASAHKYHGSRGVGILYARAGVLLPDHIPMMSGGGQERGCRSGTENVPAIVAAAVALRLMLDDAATRERRAARVRALRDWTIAALLRAAPGTQVNGDPTAGLYGLLSVTLPATAPSALDVARMLDAAGVLVSTGSACSKGKPSETLLAMGRTPAEALRTLRVSLSEFTTPRDCERLVQGVARALGAPRQ